MHPLDRYTEIGALTEKVRRAIGRTLLPLVVMLGLGAAILQFSGKPGAAAFALISIGSCVALQAWKSDAIGLPLLPMMALQSLVIYGLPIAATHDVILSYPPDYLFEAGVEVLVFDLSMILVWKLAIRTFRPGRPISYALREFNRKGAAGWAKLGFVLIFCSIGFAVLDGLGLLDPVMGALPAGASSISAALVSVVGACGFFLVSLTVGAGEVSALGRALFWTLLVVNGLLAASEFLLYAAAANLITVALGFFWSSGRIPWRYLTVSMLALSFLNTGKTTMRERHWNSDLDPDGSTSIQRMPALYAEWFQVSYDALVQPRHAGTAEVGPAKPKSEQNQSLLDRIDNIQNLLFVIDAVKTDHISTLHGATYTLIPPLLVPRILWPDKPRTHEGQILLNVHFGRQDLNSTLATYIAWGLLPEGYGNFGPLAGACSIGGFLGLAFAWIEALTARKLVVSMEGFLSLSLLLNLMNSFEMVASVLVTSTFQSFIVIIAASAPFVHRTETKAPGPSGA